MLSLMFIFFILLALCLAAPRSEAKMLYTYDLTYTLNLDREDPNQRRKAWDDAHFVSSVQGIVNRKEPRLYLYFVGGENGSIDRYWLDKLRAEDEWLADYQFEAIPDLDALIGRFRGDIEGLVVYDENVAATSNVASTIAGVEDLACVRFDLEPGSLYHHLTADLKLPVKRW